MCPMAETVRVRTDDLMKLLGSVLPMVDREPGLSIHGVLIEAAGGVLTATATDRFVLGHARVPCEGELAAPVLVWRKGAKRLLRALRGDEEMAPRERSLLSIQLAGDGSPCLGLGVDDSPRVEPYTLEDFEKWGFESYALVPAEVPGGQGTTFPDYVKVFDKWAEQKPGTGPVAVRPSLLARFDAAAGFGLPNGQMPRWRFGRHQELIRVDIGGWFAGLVAPYGSLKKTELTGVVMVARPVREAASRVEKREELSHD